MSDILPVVRVKRDGAPGGFVEINESDLTDDDVLYEEGGSGGGSKFLNVNEIKAALPDATDDELHTMLDTETKGKNRPKAIEAINAEIEKRSK